VLKDPNAWFIDQLASTATWILPKESIEKLGDMKKPEAVIGTGPWMLDRYDAGTKLVYSRNPNYFISGQPYADGVDVTIESDPATALANFLVVGGYDLAPE
jgi:peptide/nickel transport system substrate-binding protein